jgi:hypothetical protein
MTNIKHKNYALNLRRTYDIFKGDDGNSVAASQKGRPIVKVEEGKEVVK